MSTLPIPRGRAPMCACGCGHRTSTVRTEYVQGHRPRRDPAERFRENVAVGEPAACWPWIGRLFGNGYGQFFPDRWRSGSVMAHRYAYELEHGPIPDDLTIDHLCRNPACVNPAHMETVTRGENSRRGGGLQAAARSRRLRAQIACPAGHPRTPQHARKDRQGNWRCKTCRNAKLASGEWKR